MTFINDPTSVASTAATPVFDYSSRDYASIFADLVNRIPVFLPEWTSQSNNDFGIVLLQMYAYVGDLLGYYLDRLAGEAFIQTATQPVSILNLAAMLDYQPTLSVGASTVLQISLAPGAIGPITIPAGSQFQTKSSQLQPGIVFETDNDLTIAGNNAATPSITGFVNATQGITQSNEAVAVSDGSINQVYPLLFNPVSANSFVVSVDLGQGPIVWTFTQSLINNGPFEQVYTNFVDANGIFYIVFGDNVNGFVPPLGSPITCTYQTNSGSLGNVGARTIVQTVSAIIGVASVLNPSAASGGTGAESLESIRRNAPASLKTLNRGVTVGDVQTLALQVAGVEWSSAQEVTYQLVNLYIAPFGGGPPTTVLQDAVLNYVDPLMLANTDVTILSPVYVPINISANLFVYENFGNTAVQLVVAAALQNLLALPNTGFGFRVSLGLVYQIILEQAGINWAIVTGLNRQMLSTLQIPLVNGQNYTSITVQGLPQMVNAQDQIVVTNVGMATPTTITLTALAPAGAGTQTIAVAPFTANANYPIGSPIQDTTGTNDCVLLPNEIPILGTIQLTATGGFIGS